MSIYVCQMQYIAFDNFKFIVDAELLGQGLSIYYLISLSLVGEYPPQVHIKPALDVQKMENVQTCLDFLECYDVPVQDIGAVGKKERKTKQGMMFNDVMLKTLCIKKMI